jgi:beta-lactamase regulating signal transducer with metallopeptidase domain
MSSLLAFVQRHEALVAVWAVGMTVSIVFILAARAAHRRNVNDRAAKEAQHLTEAARQSDTDGL